jgi:TonB family protein
MMATMTRRFLCLCAVALALTSTAIAQLASHSDTDVDYVALIREIQQEAREPGYVGIIWWIPVEFWEKSAERGGGSAQKASEFYKSLRQYTLIVATVGKIGLGNVNWVSESDLRSNLKLRDAAGNNYDPLQKVSGDAEGLATIAKPMLANMMGTMGQSLQFYFFPAVDKAGNPIADPLSRGSFSVVITSLLGVKESVYEWRLPLTSLSPPRYCPAGKERMEANWKYCPWHGVKLEDPPAPSNITRPTAGITTDHQAGAPQSAGVLGGIIASAPVAVPKAATPNRVLVSQEVSQGLLVHQVAPEYPALARQARIQGTVVLKALISKDGSMEGLTVMSGHPMLVPAAMDAVKQWKYKPYFLNGEPVEVETTINVNFTLAGD